MILQETLIANRHLDLQLNKYVDLKLSCMYKLVILLVSSFSI